MAERITQQRQPAIGLFPHRPLDSGAGGQGPRQRGVQIGDHEVQMQRRPVPPVVAPPAHPGRRAGVRGLVQEMGLGYFLATPAQALVDELLPAGAWLQHWAAQQLRRMGRYSLEEYRCACLGGPWAIRPSRCARAQKKLTGLMVAVQQRRRQRLSL